MSALLSVTADRPSRSLARSPSHRSRDLAAWSKRLAPNARLSPPLKSAIARWERLERFDNSTGDHIHICLPQPVTDGFVASWPGLRW